MARLLRLVAQHWPIEGALAQRLEAWPGNIGPKGASLPLRLASALHALVLNGQSAQLRSAYPPQHTNDDQLIKAVQTTLPRHGRFIENWLTYPPQTNEVARSAGLIPAAMWLQHQYKLPIFLSELGFGSSPYIYIYIYIYILVIIIVAYPFLYGFSAGRKGRDNPKMGGGNLR